MARRFLLSVASVACVFAAAPSALAQTDTPASPPATTPPAEHAVGAAPTTATTTTATTTTTTTSDRPADDATDFSKIVKTIGIGYFGQYDVPLGMSGAAARTVATQLVGVRYFFSDRMGIDVGVGVGLSAGTNKSESPTNPATSVDRPSTLAMSFKVGVPIVMLSTKHYSFFFEPQALFGFAGETQKVVTPANTADTKHNGTRFFGGASAGALVQFGFLGIPQLTLDATVGLGLDISGGKTEQASAPGQTTVQKNSFSQTGFGTFTAHQPWNIFHTNVAAIYHF